MMMYDWGIFWEDGRSANLPVPFGPEHPDTLLTLDSEWVDKLEVYYPNFRDVAENNMDFGFILVNPPREALPEEEHHWNMKGYK
jgi:hypothetical protein